MTAEKLSSIPVKKSTKRLLESAKDSKSWDDLLFQLYEEWRSKRGANAVGRLRKLLGEEEVNSMLESSRRFRKELKLR